jgi:hypothetical protein
MRRDGEVARDPGQTTPARTITSGASLGKREQHAGRGEPRLLAVHAQGGAAAESTFISNDGDPALCVFSSKLHRARCSQLDAARK